PRSPPPPQPTAAPDSRTPQATAAPDTRTRQATAASGSRSRDRTRCPRHATRTISPRLSPTVPDVARPPLGTVTPDPRPSPPRVGTAHNRPPPPDLRKELLTAEHGKRVSRTTRHPRRTS